MKVFTILLASLLLAGCYTTVTDRDYVVQPWGVGYVAADAYYPAYSGIYYGNTYPVYTYANTYPVYTNRVYTTRYYWRTYPTYGVYY
jgi:hypothetical protein